MQIPRTVISATLVTVALVLPTPALAQHHRGGGEDGHGSNRGSERHATAAPRSTPPPAAAPAPRADSSSRRDNGVRAERAPGYTIAPRYNSNNGNWRGSAPSVQQSATPRSYSNGSGAYRNEGYRSYSYHGSYGQHGYYAHVAPTHFYHPYYTFRPRFSLGFGLWVGYPVPYAYSYYDPFYDAYPYPSTPYPSAPYPSYPPPSSYPQYPPAPYPQSAPDPNSIGVQPGQANTGGLSFDITPRDAEILVDGNFVGTVDQFTASSQPLGLSAGRHQVRIEAPGFQTISFDVNIIAGQVIPYQGTMERR
jgi:hypothetical protein